MGLPVIFDIPHLLASTCHRQGILKTSFTPLFAGMAQCISGFLPLVAILVFLRAYPTKDRDLDMYWMLGVPVMLLIAGSWFFVIFSGNGELFRYFIWDELVLRVFSSHHQRHVAWYSFLYIYFPN